jgi:hypothetical protein
VGRHSIPGLFLFVGLAALVLVGPAAPRPHPDSAPLRNDLTLGLLQQKSLTIVVPGNASWVDTGLDVASGQTISFEAEGRISLQKGNPDADCGADGCDLQALQQPVPGKNLGALIGKVVIAVTVTVNEKTKEEKKDEMAELFYVGSKNRLEMPAKGRLFLGINENVIGDNAGAFQVTVTAPAGAS